MHFCGWKEMFFFPVFFFFSIEEVMLTWIISLDLVGGGSQNTAIAKLAGEILGGVEGVYRLDVGGNACALGSAYKAVWAVERKLGETFEDLIGSRWREDEFVEKIADGYQEDIYRFYERGVDELEAVDKDVLN